MLVIAMLAPLAMSCGQPRSGRDIKTACGSLKTITSGQTLKYGGSVSVGLQLYDLKSCAPFLKGDLWGSTEVQPRWAVGQMTVSKGGRTLQVPAGAYLDLGDPEAITISEEDGALKVALRGAGESGWVAQYLFNETGVTERKVWNRDFPDESIQRTTFSYVDN
jgi:hypothetical protein